MSELVVNQKLRIPLSEFEFSFARGSGPGGQNVNKVNSKAVLAWDVANSPYLTAGVRERFFAEYKKRISSEGILTLASDRFRDQKKNIEDCLEKLCAMISEVFEPPVLRRATKPTRGSVERRLQSKRVGAEKKARRSKPDW